MITGRPLWGEKLAVIQAIVWVVGMTLMSGAMHVVGLLERWGVWVGLTAALVVIAYGIPVLQLIQNAPPGSAGRRTW